MHKTIENTISTYTNPSCKHPDNVKKYIVKNQKLMRLAVIFKLTSSSFNSQFNNLMIIRRK